MTTLKRMWIAAALRPRTGVRHDYTTDPETKVTTCTGSGTWVWAPVQVVGGKDDGRIVGAWLTPDEAEEQARALLEAAAEARKANERL
jgi:hypothetical protein